MGRSGFSNLKLLSWPRASIRFGIQEEGLGNEEQVPHEGSRPGGQEGTPDALL